MRVVPLLGVGDRQAVPSVAASRPRSEQLVGRGVLRVAILVLVWGLSLSLARPVRLPPPGMVWVPPGPFVMGSDAGAADERPAHEVYLPGFYIDRYEVTVEAYARFLNARGSLSCDGYPCADTWPDNPQSPLMVEGGRFQPRPGTAMLPMTWVSWYGAAAYCRFYGKRLPTEAEWEKAARGVDGRLYPWGDRYLPGRANAGGAYGGVLPVGSFPEGASPYAALDMAGNVWEWVADWYAAYPGSPVRSPFFGLYKVVRGGSWNHPPEDARTTARDIAHPARRLGVVGFRCALDLR